MGQVVTTLYASRLRLRPFAAGDWPDVAAYSIRPEFRLYLPLPPQTEESARAFVEDRVRGGQPNDAGDWHFGLQLVEASRLIGSIRIGVREQAHRQGDVGYALHPDLWGHGYATEALRRVLAFGFKNLGLERIWAIADSRNEASWRVMERAGMEREGVMRHHRLHREEWRDSVLYAAIRDQAAERAG